MMATVDTTEVADPHTVLIVEDHADTAEMLRRFLVRNGMGAEVALEFIRALDIRTVVAVGRKAQGAIAAAGLEAPAIRHPAQGGAAQFTQQLLALNASLLP